MKKIGLTKTELQKIISIIAEHSDVEEVVLFGSRALGNYKKVSDVDIAIKAHDKNIFLTSHLKDQLEERTTIPYFFDVIDYNTISSVELKKHINENGIIIYSKNTVKKTAWPYIFISLLVILLDQLTKQTVLKNIKYGHFIKIFSFLNFTMQINTGSAWSFLSHQNGWQVYFLSSISVIVSIVLIVILCRIAKRNWLLALPLSFILGGAIGNLIDRFHYGYVIDFVDFHIRTWHFAIFNVADAAVSIGAVWLGIKFFFFSKNK